MKKTVLMMAVVALLVSSAAFAANTLEVLPIAAMGGTNEGMVITHDGSTNAVYVEDRSPVDETVYRASFFVSRAGGITMDNCGGTCVTSHVVFLVRDDIDGSMGGDKTTFRIILRRLRVGNADGPRYTINVGTATNTGFRYVGGIVLSETAMRKNVMVEWQQGNGDGFTKVYARNNTSQAWSLKAERTGLTNTNFVVDYVRWGATSAIDATTSGAIWFDEFESYRTLAP